MTVNRNSKHFITQRMHDNGLPAGCEQVLQHRQGIKGKGVRDDRRGLVIIPPRRRGDQEHMVFLQFLKMVADKSGRPFVRQVKIDLHLHCIGQLFFIEG